MGISYGHCRNCTPGDVFTLENQLRAEEKAAGRKYDEIHAAERKIYVRLSTSAIRIRHDNAYEKGKKGRDD